MWLKAVKHFLDDVKLNRILAHVFLPPPFSTNEASTLGFAISP
jgi:hypothetical protein